MKFYQVPIGQRFKLDGTIYIKTSPLVANQIDDGSQKLIKRAVTVELLDQASNANAVNKLTATEYEVARNAINDFYDKSLLILNNHADLLAEAEISQLRDSFSRLREDLLEGYSK